MVDIPLVVLLAVLGVVSAVIYWLPDRRLRFFVAFLFSCGVVILGIEAGDALKVTSALVWLVLVRLIDRPRVRSPMPGVLKRMSYLSRTKSTEGDATQGRDREEELRLRAKEIIRDLLSGLQEGDLAGKYGLTAREAAVLREKLKKIGIACEKCGRVWPHPSPRCPYCGAETGLIIRPQ